MNTSKTTGYEGWITSDGRAYLVYLFEEDDGEGDGNISGRSVSEAPAGTGADSDKKVRLTPPIMLMLIVSDNCWVIDPRVRIRTQN